MKVAFLRQTLLHDGKQLLQAPAQPRVLFALQLVQYVPDVARHEIWSHALQIAAREEGRRLSKIRPGGRQRDSRLATQVCGRVRRHDRVDGEPQIGTDAWNARLNPGRLLKVDEPTIVDGIDHSDLTVGQSVIAFGRSPNGEWTRFNATINAFRERAPHVVVKYISDLQGNTIRIGLPSPVTAYVSRTDIEVVES